MKHDSEDVRDLELIIKDQAQKLRDIRLQMGIERMRFEREARAESEYMMGILEELLVTIKKSRTLMRGLRGLRSKIIREWFDEMQAKIKGAVSMEKPVPITIDYSQVPIFGGKRGTFWEN